MFSSAAQPFAQLRGVSNDEQIKATNNNVTQNVKDYQTMT